MKNRRITSPVESRSTFKRKYVFPVAEIWKDCNRTGRQVTSTEVEVSLDISIGMHDHDKSFWKHAALSL